jgi:hypothetical protein
LLAFVHDLALLGEDPQQQSASRAIAAIRSESADGRQRAQSFHVHDAEVSWADGHLGALPLQVPLDAVVGGGGAAMLCAGDLAVGAVERPQRAGNLIDTLSFLVRAGRHVEIVVHGTTPVVRGSGRRSFCAAENSTFCKLLRLRVLRWLVHLVYTLFGFGQRFSGSARREPIVGVQALACC